jgi:hypothetical protein
MTEADIQCLKGNIDKLVEIRTVDDECLVARIQFVSHSDEYDEHDVLYEVVSSNRMDFYLNHKDSGGFVIDFEKIVSVKPVAPPHGPSSLQNDERLPGKTIFSGERQHLPVQR